MNGKGSVRRPGQMPAGNWEQTFGKSPAPPVKAALCINTADAPLCYTELAKTVGVIAVPLRPVPGRFVDETNDLFARTPFMADRATCEDDLSKLQLLPYGVLWDKEADKVFMYTRGKAGAENKLHDRLSIGLGGHVDRMPEAGESLEDTLTDELLRELTEEVGLVIDPEQIVFTHMMAADLPVDKVHMGLLSVIEIQGISNLTAEEGVIEKGSFVKVDELFNESVYSRLENWSKLALAIVTYQRDFGSTDGVFLVPPSHHVHPDSPPNHA